jgi:hypothetical protein
MYQEDRGREHKRKNSLKYSSLDIIVSEDHGQKAFRAAAHIILRGDGLKKEMTFGIGSIDCKKDTAGLLNASLAPKLNEGLKRFVRYTRSSST